MDIVASLLSFLGSQGTVGFVLILLAGAFMTWAIVVWKIGKNILDKLDRVEHSISYLDHRVLKIETYLELQKDDFTPYRNGSLT